MTQRYLLIASEDPFTSKGIETFYALARDLVGAGLPVTLFLVQNGVLPTRRSPSSPALTALAEGGVRVLADAFSLRERGIPGERLAEGVKVAALDQVIEALAEGAKVLWH